MIATPGPLLFARYAYPPCDLEYCGPDAAPTLLEYGAAHTSDPDLVSLSRGFDGAWPYLELIAHSNAIADPLDERVVEAYWIGSDLLDRVDRALLGDHLEHRFRGQAESAWRRLVSAVDAGGVPHHNFHVFVVYPWVGLMRLGHTVEPLRVLDKCRIRWAIVEAVDGDLAYVRSPSLRWTRTTLVLGIERTEVVRHAMAGSGFVSGLRPGEVVSVHWDWVCDRISARQRMYLDRYTSAALRVANGAPSSASAVLG